MGLPCFDGFQKDVTRYQSKITSLVTQAFLVPLYSQGKITSAVKYQGFCAVPMQSGGTRNKPDAFAHNIAVMRSFFGLWPGTSVSLLRARVFSGNDLY